MNQTLGVDRNPADEPGSVRISLIPLLSRIPRMTGICNIFMTAT